MKKICKIFAAVLITGLSFVSCKNNFSIDSQLEENDKAFLSFAINENEERKITPDTLSWKEVDSIELTKNDEELKTWKTSAEKTAYDQMKAENSITLDYGKYNFAITLKDKAGDILQTGKLNNFEIKGGKNLLNFETKACLEGKGNLKIHCSCKDFGNTIYLLYYEITPLKGGDEISDSECYDEADSVTLNFDNLDCGEYIVKLEFYFDDELTISNEDNCIVKTELVEVQNKRETVFNCVASEETQYVPIDYLFLNGDSVEFTEEVSLYNLGASLPSVDIIKNKPEGANFLGWFDNDDNKLTKLPETSTEKVSIIAKFEKTATTAEDISDERVIYNVIPTADTWEDIYNYINCTGIVCSRLDLSNIKKDISKDNFGDIKVQEVILPNSLISLCDGAFNENSTLTRIVLPEQLVRIGVNAFYHCKLLKEIIIPSTLSEIGENAFSDCENLEKVTFEKNINLTSIQNGIFSNCTSLKEISIPASVEKIYTNAFVNCENLEAVSFGENSKLTSIGANAFENCSKLKEITIPKGVETIGNYAFCFGIDNKPTQLEKVIFEKDSELETIGDSAFYKCKALKEISIPAGVTKIDFGAFADCENLEKVTFEGDTNLTTIGDNAFSSCTSLKEITIPASVTAVGSTVFIYCENLLITIPYSLKDSFMYELQYDSYSFKVIIEDGTESIETEAFNGCISLKEVVIPASVTEIGERAFFECSKLKKVIFETGSKLTSIGDFAFSECSSLEEINIPETVTTIGESAFNGCGSLKEIYIPSGVTEIKKATFFSCAALEDVEFDFFTSKPKLETIGDNAFESCSSLTEITLPYSLTSIGYRAFANCTSLELCDYEEGITVDENAFDNCPRLRK